MKLHQRAWAGDQGLDWITWTFDPLVRRNAWFNIGVLGAQIDEYLVDFYGQMDDAINGRDPSDRLLVAWSTAGDAPDHLTQPPVPPGAVTVPTPDDIVVLRRTDAVEASSWRLRLREELGGRLGDRWPRGRVHAGRRVRRAPGARRRRRLMLGDVACSSPTGGSPPSTHLDADRDGAPLRVDVSIVDAANPDGRVDASLDTTSGRLTVSRARSLDGADVTSRPTTARPSPIVRSADGATALEAFLAGRILVQGGVMPSIALAGEIARRPTCRVRRRGQSDHRPRPRPDLILPVCPATTQRT